MRIPHKNLLDKEMGISDSTQLGPSKEDMDAGKDMCVCVCVCVGGGGGGGGDQSPAPLMGLSFSVSCCRDVRELYLPQATGSGPPTPMLLIASEPQ